MLRACFDKGKAASFCLETAAFWHRLASWQKSVLSSLVKEAPEAVSAGGSAQPFNRSRGLAGGALFRPDPRSFQKPSRCSCGYSLLQQVVYPIFKGFSVKIVTSHCRNCDQFVSKMQFSHPPVAQFLRKAHINTQKEPTSRTRSGKWRLKKFIKLWSFPVLAWVFPSFLPL